MEYDFEVTTTLSFLIRNNSELLLTLKKRGFGQGKWNTPGGKVEAGESAEASAIREIKEEVGIDVMSIKNLGFIEFVWPAEKSEYNTRCFIFLATDFSGEAKESDECRPGWFRFDAIPYDQMWDDDKHWYPEALAGKMFKKRFFFSPDERVVTIEDI
ncbi:MAG: 8-oxo-dGTP diphosphatase [Candidatus Buchananbacteria bacterium]|nr:8-oxo-dGTP diphosphatase [Candidatus Buchananbacteria bacterium]